LMIKQVLNVMAGSGEEVVHTEHLAPAFQQSLRKMRTEKSGTTRNENTSLKVLHVRSLPNVSRGLQRTLTVELGVCLWLSSKSGVCWPRQDLSSDLGSPRIIPSP